MRNNHKISNPIFIFCLSILILNDWYFKTIFHNGITGKLSDFAGLFAFPFFLSALFPSKTLKIHIWTGILFIIWKSAFSQPIIDLFNNLNIPINRTIDFTDSIALISIFASYFAIKSDFTLNIKPILVRLLVVISCLAFMATTLPPRTKRKFLNIEKEYAFPFSKRELVSRLNMVQIKEVREFNKFNGLVDFNSETNVFHYHGWTDTLAILLDYQKIKDEDTIQFKTTFAEILITGNDTNSKIKLLSVYKFVPKFKDKDYRNIAIKQFEKRIIKKIKNYR